MSLVIFDNFNNKKTKLFMSLFLLFFLVNNNFSENISVSTNKAKTGIENSLNTVLNNNLNKQVSLKIDNLINSKIENQDILIPFVFDKKPLSSIIELIAEYKNINIVMPQLAAEQEAIKKQTITYRPQDSEKIYLDEAWQLFLMFLDLSGFAIAHKEKNIWIISRLGKKGEAGIQQETIPLFIDTPTEELPNSDLFIRYIAYFRNLTVPATLAEEKDNAISKIIAQMKSVGSSDPIYDSKSNGIILVDKADVISSIMNIIKTLDSTGFRETISVLQLNNVPAAEVASVFTKLKAAAGKDIASPFIRAQRTEGLSSFASDTTIIPDNRLNALIIMGRESAVNRIEDFITNYIDLEPESGKSILHVYDLQYLDATEFAPVLQQIIGTPGHATTGTGAQGQQATSPTSSRFFEGAVVFPEGIDVEKEAAAPVTNTETARVSSNGNDTTAVGITGPIFKGGNRLLVAATKNEWEKIKKIIRMADLPEPQVILEVYIVDFTNTNNRILSGTFRNRTGEPFGPEGVQFLASHISAPANVLGATPTQLAEDLLGVISSTSSSLVPLTSLLPKDTLIFSFNDPQTPGIFGLLQVLDTYSHLNIVSHPFLISTNNKRGTVTSTYVQRVPGNVVSTGSGSIDIQIQNLDAAIQVQMIPHLSSLDRLNLQISVDINEFQTSSANRRVRRVNTDAILNTGQIFVIGGLKEFTESDIKYDTPFISKIPIIGKLFSGITKTTITHNFMLFISPTIVPTKLRSGLNIYTTDRIREGRRDISDIVVFGKSVDPVTRLFFGQEEDADNAIKEYLLKTTNAPKFSEIETGKEIKRAKLRVPPAVVKRSVKSNLDESVEDVII